MNTRAVATVFFVFVFVTIFSAYTLQGAVHPFASPKKVKGVQTQVIPSPTQSEERRIVQTRGVVVEDDNADSEPEVQAAVEQSSSSEDAHENNDSNDTNDDHEDPEPTVTTEPTPEVTQDPEPTVTESPSPTQEPTPEVTQVPEPTPTVTTEPTIILLPTIIDIPGPPIELL